jgi:hypothetical protein
MRKKVERIAGLQDLLATWEQAGDVEEVRRVNEKLQIARKQLESCDHEKNRYGDFTGTTFPSTAPKLIRTAMSFEHATQFSCSSACNQCRKKRVGAKVKAGAVTAAITG